MEEEVKKTRKTKQKAQSVELSAEILNRYGITFAAEILQELGVEELDDLQYLREEHLRQIGTPPVKATKFLTRIGKVTEATSGEKKESDLRPKPTFPRFDGQPHRFAAWKRATIAAFGQLGMREVLAGTRAPTMKENSYIFDILAYATADGSGRYRLKPHEAELDGAAAWTSLLEWYEGPTSNAATASETRLRMLHAKMRHGNASAYIDLYVECLSTLTEKGEPFPENQAIEAFIDGIDSGEFMDLKEIFLDEKVRGEAQNLHDLIRRLRQRERSLNKNAAPKLRTATRRVKGSSARASLKKRHHGRSHNRSVQSNLGGYNGREHVRTKEVSSRQQADEEKHDAAAQKAHAKRPFFPRKENKARRTKYAASDAARDYEENSHVETGNAIGNKGIDVENINTVVILDSGSESSILNDSWEVIYSRPAHHSLVGFDSTDTPITVESIVTAAAIYTSPIDRMDYLLIVHEADYVPHASETLLVPNHLRESGATVDDTPKRLGGSQEIVAHCGTVISLENIGANLGFQVRRPTAAQINELSMVFLTPDSPWDPVQGRVVRRKRTTNTRAPWTEKIISPEELHKWQVNLSTTAHVAKKTLENTTRLASVQMAGRLRRHLKARFPALNVRRLNEKVYTDTFYASVPSVKGNKCAQIFSSSSGCVAIYPMKRESQFPDILLEEIKSHGAPKQIVSDNANAEISTKVKNVLNQYMIRQGTTEPHSPWQNRAERAIQSIKYTARRLMRENSAPANLWDYALVHAAHIHNRKSMKRLGWRTPLEVREGETPDISHLVFGFYRPVLYYDPDSFPNDNEKPARLLTPAETSGDTQAWYIQTMDGTILVRSVFKPTSFENMKRPGTTEESSTDNQEINRDVFINHPHFESRGLNEEFTALEIDDDLADEAITLGEQDAAQDISASEEEPSVEGRDISSSPDEQQPPDHSSGEIDRNSLADRIGDRVAKMFLHPSTHRPKLYFGTVQSWDPDQKLAHITFDDGDEEDLDSDELRSALRLHQNHKAKDSEQSRLYKLDRIVDHKIDGTNISYLVAWSDGTETWVPQKVMREDDPITTAQYLRQQGLDETHGFKWVKTYLRHNRRTASVATNRFGITVPKTAKKALALDQANGDTLWQDAMNKEIQALMNMNAFEFKPKGSKIPKDYKYCPFLWVFAVKSDLRRKARLVMNGSIVDKEHELERYSPVLQIKSGRILATIAHSRGQQIRMADVSNAYINADTRENIWTQAGPEFDDKAGMIILVRRAMYGLPTSGREWCAHLARALTSMGFRRTLGDPSIWMRKDMDNGVWEYIAHYVDDILVISHDPDKHIESLQEAYHLKNTEDSGVYLGQNFQKDQSGMITIGSQNYWNETVTAIEKVHGPLREYGTPMLANDPPELDDSQLLSQNEQRDYQRWLGTGQWMVTIGRYDIAYAINTLARHSASPRQGHLKRLLRVYGYIAKHPDLKLVMDSNPIKVDCPSFNWDEDHLLEYPKCTEQEDAMDEKLFPKPDGTKIKVVYFTDADHGHDKQSGRSVTGFIGFLGSAPVEWYSKRQSTVSTSTYASEFAALRTTVEAAEAMMYYLRSLGVEPDGPATILSDNMSVLQSTTPGNELKKKHVMLYYHKTRQAVAHGIVTYAFVESQYNIADLFTKAINRIKHWNLLSMVPQE